MKKVFYKLLLTLVILSLALPFILKRPDGQPLLSLADIGQDLSALGDNIKSTVLSSIETVKQIDDSNDVNGEQDQPKTTTLYRWQDARGQWHFSNKPSETGQSFKITPNSSIQSPRQAQPVSNDEDTVTTAKSDQKSTEQNEDLPLPLSTKQAIKTLEDAKNIQKLMDNRSEQLDEALRQAAQ